MSDDWSFVDRSGDQLSEGSSTLQLFLGGSDSDICKEVTRMEMFVDIGGEGRVYRHTQTVK